MESWNTFTRRGKEVSQARLASRCDPINPLDNYFLPPKRSAPTSWERRRAILIICGLSRSETKPGSYRRTMAHPPPQRGQCTSGVRFTHAGTWTGSSFNLYRYVAPPW